MQNAFCKTQNSLKIILPAFLYAPEKWVYLSKEKNIMIPRENGTIQSN